jgi:hypothetical protein
MISMMPQYADPTGEEGNSPGPPPLLWIGWEWVTAGSKGGVGAKMQKTEVVRGWRGARRYAGNDFRNAHPIG